MTNSANVVYTYSSTRELMTTRAKIAELRAFGSWQDYQEALKRAVASLTDEQLGQRLLPGRRTPGEIAEHIVFGRALHLSRTLGADAAGLAPYLRWRRHMDVYTQAMLDELKRGGMCIPRGAETLAQAAGSLA